MIKDLSFSYTEFISTKLDVKVYVLLLVVLKSYFLICTVMYFLYHLCFVFFE